MAESDGKMRYRDKLAGSVRLVKRSSTIALVREAEAAIHNNDFTTIYCITTERPTTFVGFTMVLWNTLTVGFLSTMILNLRLHSEQQHKLLNYI